MGTGNISSLEGFLHSRLAVRVLSGAAERCSSLQGVDVRQVSSLPPAQSLMLLPTRSAHREEILQVHFECVRQSVHSLTFSTDSFPDGRVK